MVVAVYDASVLVGVGASQTQPGDRHRLAVARGRCVEGGGAAGEGDIVPGLPPVSVLPVIVAEVVPSKTLSAAVTWASRGSERPKLIHV